MYFDYGCELIRWSKNNSELEQGIDQIVIAADRLLSVCDKIPKEDYLKEVRTHSRIKKLMEKA